MSIEEILEGNAKHELEVMYRPKGSLKPIGGRLDNWSKWGRRSYIGDLHDDPNGRWPEGTRITTSSTVKEYAIDGKQFIETLNTTYELGEKL